MTSGDSHLCTALEAAHRLGVPLSTVQRLVACGALDAQRHGRRCLIPVVAVERYAERRRRCGIR
jgi:excisionase family DNA binding protein